MGGQQVGGACTETVFCCTSRSTIFSLPAPSAAKETLVAIVSTAPP